MMYDSTKDEFVKIKKQNIVYNTNPIPININNDNDNNDIKNIKNINNIDNKNNIPIKVNSCCCIM